MFTANWFKCFKYNLEMSDVPKLREMLENFQKKAYYNIMLKNI